MDLEEKLITDILADKEIDIDEAMLIASGITSKVKIRKYKNRISRLVNKIKNKVLNQTQNNATEAQQAEIEAKIASQNEAKLEKDTLKFGLRNQIARRFSAGFFNKHMIITQLPW